MISIKKLSVIFIVLLLCVLLLSAYYISPVLNNIPEPTGQYSVGTQLLTLQNNNAGQEKYATYHVELFYPISKHNDHTQYPYQPEKIAALKDMLSQDSIIPRIIWNRLLTTSYTYAQPNASLASFAEKYPVIFYLPGLGSADLHNVYLEELASHGYIVCAIEPSHDILAAVFSDNIVPLNPTLKTAIQENNRSEIYAYRNEAHNRWSKLIDNSIEVMRSLDKDHTSMFYQKLDLTAIGLMGHSHGGAVVTDYCQNNHVCKAGINMDGWTKTYNKSTRFETPFLFMLSETGEMAEMNELFENNKRTTFNKIVITGSSHGSFSDEGILLKWPFDRLISQTKKNSSELRKEIAHHIVSFFNTYLRR